MIDEGVLDRLGIFVGEDGGYQRYRVRNDNFEFDPTDPKAQLRGKLIAYDQQKVPYPVVMSLATDPDSIEEARKKAAAARSDFYHPKHGWLRWGRKREREAPENLGAGAVQYATTRVRVAAGTPDPQPEPEPQPQPLPDPVEAPTPTAKVR